jgi:hypothetical protein
MPRRPLDDGIERALKETIETIVQWIAIAVTASIVGMGW